MDIVHLSIEQSITISDNCKEFLQGYRSKYQGGFQEQLDIEQCAQPNLVG